MGIFVEDLLNFGNLIDAELEIRLTVEELGRAYPNVDFEIRDELIKCFARKRCCF